MKAQVGSKENVSAEVQEIREKSNGIRMTTKVQKLAISEITELIMQITEGSESITQGSEELTSSSEEISGMAESLKSRVDYFKI